MPGHERRHGSGSGPEHNHEHEHDESVRPRGDTDAHDGGGTARLFRAAVAGRSDVVGTAGMTSLQRAVGNRAAGAVLSRNATAAGSGAAHAPEETADETAEERSPVHDVISTGGSPLDTDTRTDMESRMGADFSDVRVHTDSAAHESAKAVGAHAYTVGHHVVFQRDSYDPSSSAGRTTLAHELTHVVQQRNGPVEGAAAPGGIRVSDPSDRFEREATANAERVMSSAPDPAPVAGPAPAAPAPSVQSLAAGPSVPSVQREAAEDEDEEPADVQGSFVQREAEGAEEEEEEPPA
ncbi:eCIS core domain-containing protein [Streptomyces paludis]|uniref:DUF4157 domain-containing protein n=1 Tax=Streptomyces paludis TaxID=2282738 RepID=A0A345HJ39_9ACTN|nr:DUF4157 domain-containing protein [Streptomyces paludis]AXG76713.1 DUF4157 domain-containing protein [Streptomyces paludis]